jgi:hypothetical protein
VLFSFVLPLPPDAHAHKTKSPANDVERITDLPRRAHTVDRNATEVRRDLT